MKYWQPYGITDPEAGYINGDPSIGRQGSIPPAGSIEQDQREIVNVIRGNQFPPSETDVHQLLVSCRSQRMNYAVDQNDLPNTITVSFVPPIGSEFLTPGLMLRIKPLIDNTDACTLIVDSVEHPLRRCNGAELVAGDIVNGIPIEVMWNDGGYWIMTNYKGVGGDNTVTNTNNYLTKIPYCADTGTSGHIIANFPTPITNPVAGDAILVKLGHNLPGPTGITINALPEAAVVRPNGAALQAGDGATAQVGLFIRSDAGNWQFTGILPPAPQGPNGMFLPVGSLIFTCAANPFPGTLPLNGAVLVRAEHPGLWAFAQWSGRIVDEATWANGGNWAWGCFSTYDGITYFRLPHFGGEFLRMNDMGRGVDAARNWWQWQPESVGQIYFSGSVDLLNPKVLFGPMWVVPGMTPPDSYMGWGELTWLYNSGGRGYQSWDATSQSGDSGFAGNLDICWTCGPGAAFSQVAYPWYNPAGSQGGFLFQHFENRIRADVYLSGSGGGTETRPRNLAVMPCIVDG